MEKLEELLHRITLVENESGPDASIWEFIMLLKGDHGGEVIRRYVQDSPKCSELLMLGRLGQGGQLLCDVFELIVEVLSRAEGKNESIISRHLDKFAGSLVRKYLGDIYIELDSTELRCQTAALLLMTSIVRRGPGLAYKVSSCFDFQHAAFTKLAERNWIQTWNNSEILLRQAYVEFAISFLEIGKPDLLSCVLQQKKMYSGVLCWLSSDFNDTLIYALSTLRDRVLIEEAFVPPISLFRSAALNELIFISAIGGQKAGLAYDFLVLACTDPCNGLMPNLEKGLRGNSRRMIKVMKLLDPIIVQYHRDLLLAIVNGRPSFGLSYLKEFPYNVKNFKSRSWLSAICLATSLISLIRDGLDNQSFKHLPHDLDVQEVMECMFTCLFSSSLINKGLLHACIMAKHATLRLLFELLKLLDTIIISEAHKLDYKSSYPSEPMQCAQSIKQEMQNDVQASLPDLKDLLSLQCSNHFCVKGFVDPFKYRDAARREANSDKDSLEEDRIGMVGEIWGVGMSSMTITSLKEVEVYQQSEVYKALNYLHA